MSYLENYIDKVQNLPIDVNRYLRQIKELDIRLSNASIKQEDIQDDYLQQLKNVKQKKGNLRKLDTEKIKIERLQKECLALSQEKMDIADQLYVNYDVYTVDDSIKELETNLKIFEQELRVDSLQLIKPEKENVSSKKKKKYDQKLINKMREQRKQERTLNQQLNKENQFITDWKLHPDEPKYCYCNKYSYGEMVKCDNNFCAQEWFHYDCAGLQAQPKGKWYCKNCSLFKKSKLIN